MNWITLGTSLAKIGAPMLASVFLGPEAGPLVGVLVGKLADALGVAAGATPDQTAAAVQTAIATDPGAAAKVQAVEATHADTIEAYLTDIENARTMNVQVIQSGSVLAWATPSVALVAVAGFLSIAGYLAVVGDMNTRVTILAAMIGGWTTVLNFYLGASKGGSDRANQITSMLQSTIAAHPVIKRK